MYATLVAGITLLIIYMKTLLDSDWSKTAQLLCNCVKKCVIPCRNLKFRAKVISKLKKQRNAEVSMAMEA